MLKLSRIVTVISILIITSVSTLYINDTDVIKITKSLAEFPLSIGKWTGRSDHFEEWVQKKTGADDYFLGNYYDDEGNYINLYIGYYENQQEGDAIHSPRNCMPGSGWNIINTYLIDLNLPNQNYESAKARILTIQNGLKKQIVLYWYHSRGRIIYSEYFHKFYLILDSLTKNRTDGSFIRLMSPISKNEEKTLEILKSFSIKIFPIIQNHIPS